MFKHFALQAGCLLLQHQNARYNNLESWSISFLYNNNCDCLTKTALSKAEPGQNGINTGDGLPFAQILGHISSYILEKMDVGAAF